MTYPIIMNGDHAEFEAEHANSKPEDRPDWPLPSFDATDWAKCFCKIATELGYKNADGEPIDEGWMIGWFANALMRGFDEHVSLASDEASNWPKVQMVTRHKHNDWYGEIHFARRPDDDELAALSIRLGGFTQADKDEHLKASLLSQDGAE